MNEQTAVVPVGGQKMLSALVAETWSVPEDTMMAVVKKQLIQVAPSLKREANSSEIVVYLSIVHQYGLNPMLRQVHGWVDKEGRLVTMVGYDGFVDFAINPKRPGKPFTPRYRYSEDEASVEVGYQDNRRTVKSWEWIECWAEFEDGKTTDPIRCYFAEWVTPKWKQPRNRHRMKAYCMVVREVRGFGVMDETDFEKYLESAPDDRAAAGTARGIDALKDKLAAKNESAALQAQAVDAEVVESGAPPDEGAERTEPSGTEPADGGGAGCVLSGSLPASPEPETPKRGRPVGSKNKPKEGGAEPPAVAADSPAAPPPAPLPPTLERVLGDGGEVAAEEAATCYFCGSGWNKAIGDKHPLPDGKGTLAYRCSKCKAGYEAELAKNAPGLPATDSAPGLPCSAPDCPVRGATVKCVDCGYVFCKAHLKLLPNGDAICRECDPVI